MSAERSQEAGNRQGSFASIPTAAIHNNNTGSVRVRVSLEYEQFRASKFLFF